MQNDQKQKFIYILENTVLLATSIANFVQNVQPLIQELQTLNYQLDAAENKVCSCLKSEILAEAPTFSKVEKSKSILKTDFVVKTTEGILAKTSTTTNFNNNVSGLQIEETHNEEIVEQIKEELLNKTNKIIENKFSNETDVTRLEAVDVVELINRQSISEKEQLMYLQKHNLEHNKEKLNLANNMVTDEDKNKNLEETQPTFENNSKNVLSDTKAAFKKETNVEIVTKTVSKNAIALKFVDFEITTSSPTTLKVISRVKFNSRAQ